MIFTLDEQKEHRASFIKDARARAWGAICHAEFVSKELDKLGETFEKYQKEAENCKEEAKKLETALDYHTVENREKRKALMVRVSELENTKITEIFEAMKKGQQAHQSLLQAAETALDLATHAETWEMKEAPEVVTSNKLEAVTEEEHANEGEQHTDDDHGAA